MPIEKERKFLVLNDLWKENVSSFDNIIQGYISVEPSKTVRVRIFGGKGFLAIKGLSMGDSRLEYEYEIPYKHAQELLESICIKPLLTKKRYNILENGNAWIVDKFLEENEGLYLAEFEYSDTNIDILTSPKWLGQEVTGDKRYYNSYLCENPYKYW